MQGTQVRALVREDPTCCGATKPMCHNYWAYALEPASHNYWSPRAYRPCSATREATAMRSLRTTTKSSPCSPQLEKARVQQRRPNAAKNKVMLNHLMSIEPCYMKEQLTIAWKYIFKWYTTWYKLGSKRRREKNIGESWNQVSYPRTNLCQVTTSLSLNFFTHKKKRS